MSTSSYGVVFGKFMDGTERASQIMAAMVRVEDGVETKHICSGVLVDDNILLTASHCFKHFPTHVRFGTSVLEAPESEHAITGGELRPRGSYFGLISRDNLFVGRNGFDIALVKFDGVVPQKYKSAVLADSHMVISKKSRLGILGYGVTDVKKWDTSKGRLAVAAVEASKDYRGANAKIRFPYQSDKLVANSCLGDSGGPMVYYDDPNTLIVVGLVSTTSFDCLNGQATYENIAFHANWIQKNILKLQ